MKLHANSPYTRRRAAAIVVKTCHTHARSPLTKRHPRQQHVASARLSSSLATHHSSLFLIGCAAIKNRCKLLNVKAGCDL
jgi:uncharacterized protein (UPF0548 family)